MAQDRPPTTTQLRCSIDGGATGDKPDFPDPAARLGTADGGRVPRAARTEAAFRADAKPQLNRAGGDAEGGRGRPAQSNAGKAGSAKRRLNPTQQGSVSHPRVVIVGGGFGGLAAVWELARAPVDVLLVDAQNHHCFQPLLYQAATAALAPSDIAWPIRHILRGQANATVLMASALGVDAERRMVSTSAGDFAFDYLVLATGAAHSYFGHDEWKAYAPALKTIEDAIAIRSRTLKAFERAEASDDPDERERLLTFAIIGGGATGVELAGALAELARRTLPPEFRRSNPGRARILLLEAGPRLLPSFPKRLSEVARRSLIRKGVEVLTGTEVEDVREGAIVADGRRIDIGGPILWAAGVRSSPAGRWLDAPCDASGRTRVEPDLTAPGRPNIFVIGDAAAAVGPDGGQAPGLAPAAKQMGRYAARVIRARLKGRPDPEPFRYRDQGSLATIGRNSALVKIGRVALTGFPGWVFWSAAHIYFLIGARSRLFVALSWAWSYVSFQRGARLITQG
jgi:NADH:quinone reductase (non-electrogenic)